MSDLHLHFHLPSGADISPIIINQLRKIIMDQAALATALSEISGNLALTSTALGEHSTKLTETGAILSKATDEIVVALSNNGQTDPVVDAAIMRLKDASAALALQGTDLLNKSTALKASADGLDALNVDAPPAP